MRGKMGARRQGCAALSVACLLLYCTALATGTLLPVRQTERQKSIISGAHSFFKHRNEQKPDGGRRLLTNSDAATSATTSAVNVLNPQRIRIYTEYQQTSGLTAAEAAELELNVEIAVRVLQKFYLINYPIVGNFRIQPVCVTDSNVQDDTLNTANCDGTVTPDFSTPNVDPSINMCGPHATFNQSQVGPELNYAGGPGVAADYIFYVTSLSDSVCGEAGSSSSSDVIAYAGYCQLYYDTANGYARPGVGYINVCPSVLAPSFDKDTAIEVMTHEMHHALGFSPDLFTIFSNGKGGVRTDILGSYSAPGGGAPISVIVAPEVVDYGRSYFNCTNLAFVRLEDEGGESTAVAHWEYFLLQGDIMMGETPFSLDGSPPRISAFTLLLMQASGWYTANLTQAYPLTWGRGAGCDFAIDCNTFIADNPHNAFFCTTAEAQLAATSNDGGGSSCNINQDSQVVCQGDVALADGCPMLLNFNEGNLPTCVAPPSNASASFDAVTDSSSGIDYSCVEPSSVVSVVNSGGGTQSPLCYKTSCGPNNALSYEIGGQTISCPSGQSVDLAKVAPSLFVSGVLTCPDNDFVCGYTLNCPDDCSSTGQCVDNSCICRLMYEGDGCQTRESSLLNTPLPPVDLSTVNVTLVTSDPGSPLPSSTLSYGNITTASTTTNQTAVKTNSSGSSSSSSSALGLRPQRSWLWLGGIVAAAVAPALL